MPIEQRFALLLLLTALKRAEDTGLTSLIEKHALRPDTVTNFRLALYEVNREA